MTLPVPLPHLLHFSPRRLRLAAGVVVFGVALVAPFASPSTVAGTGPPQRPASVLRQFKAVELPTADSTTGPPREPRREVQHRSPPRRLVRLRIPRNVRPASGPVSSPFGWRRHPVSGRSRHHDGADLAVPLGSTIRAVTSGTVRFVGKQSGYGLVVEIDHPAAFGRASFRTFYAHLSSSDRRLRLGARVMSGQPIGASGGVPGRDGVSTGPHLHFEVRDVSGQPLDPAPFLGTVSVRQRTDEQRWQVMFSSGRKPQTARSVRSLSRRPRAAFALPRAAGSRVDSRGTR